MLLKGACKENDACYRESKPPYSLATPLGGLGLLLLLLHARLVIEPPFLDFGKKALFRQFPLKILNGFLYLIISDNYFHIK